MIIAAPPKIPPKLHTAPKLKFVTISSPIPPKCRDCKYFSYEKCTLFKYSDVSYTEYISTAEARVNELLCGLDGRYFKEK